MYSESELKANYSKNLVSPNKEPANDEELMNGIHDKDFVTPPADVLPRESVVG